jgi:hypothetical protein
MRKMRDYGAYLDDLALFADSQKTFFNGWVNKGVEISDVNDD